MLSKHNIDNLNEDGLYKHKPDVKYRGKLYEDSLYHCCNWTFSLIKNSDGKYYMRDTYWSTGDGLHIELTDENVGEFEFVFDMSKVKKISEKDVNKYEKHYRVGIDSGGWSYPKYFVDKESTKRKDLVIQEIDKKIKELEWKLNDLRERKENIEKGTYSHEWF